MRFGPRVLVASAVLLVGAPLAADQPQQSVRSEPVRGVWVTRTALTSPDRIRAMVAAAGQGGFNTLLVQVRGRGEAFYRSSVEPRAAELDRQPEEFDPLALTIDLARRARLQVHAWVNVNLVASGTTLPRSRGHVAIQHPAWLMAPRALAPTLRDITPRSPEYLRTLAGWTRATPAVEGLYLSPILHESQEYSAKVIRELVERYPLDGVHFDYIRYPAADFDYSPAALAAFRAHAAPRIVAAGRTRLDRVAQTDPAAWPSALPAEWSAFRRDRLTALARRLATLVRAVRPGTTVSAAVVPSAEEARDARLQDWLVWARAGHLDVVCPMIYTTNAAEFAALAADIDARLGDTPVWAGVGAYRLPLAQTIEHVRLARRAGAAGVLLFSYEQLSDAGTRAAELAALRPVLLEARSGTASR